MHIVTVTLTPHGNPPPRTVLSPGDVDLFWVSALPGDGLEHLHLHPGAARAHLTFFIKASDAGAATDAARNIARRATETSPALRGWQAARV
ncbi:hypothetical protein [Streptomyces sp. NBC_00859]|uniref:hypothetical protein n=1 Tax=Streptomyces sp. NBC_00859 TaxID=2903682 RepID=UPI00386AE489|nr:RNA-binding protein [Streptomyces sp. NBC_00859]